MGTLTRCDPPRALMQCLGLVPSEYSAGAQRPCPTRPRRRRLGLSLSRESQPPLAPAPRNTPPKPPSHPVESPREALSTLPAPRGTRQTRHCRDRGHGQRGAHHTVRPTESADSPTPSAGVPRCIGRDAAPGWWNPRRRSEAATGHASRDRGRHPTEARKVVANPRRAAGSTVAYCWLRLCRCTEDNNIMQT